MTEGVTIAITVAAAWLAMRHFRKHVKLRGQRDSGRSTDTAGSPDAKQGTDTDHGALDPSHQGDSGAADPWHNGARPVEAGANEQRAAPGANANTNARSANANGEKADTAASSRKTGLAKRLGLKRGPKPPHAEEGSSM